jgi:large subunit ribosomal protein L9
MEVILLENIDKLGGRGQVVKVADGYGRNFLLPKKLAVAATSQNRKWVDQQRVRFLKLEAKEKGEAADLSKLLEGVSVSLVRRAGDKGNLFGSVTSMDIAEKLVAQGFHIDRRKINLHAPIKTLGDFTVSLKLHRDVATTIKVHVEPDEETKAKLDAAAEALAREAAHVEKRQQEKAEAAAAEAALEAAPEAEAGAAAEAEKE